MRLAVPGGPTVTVRQRVDEGAEHVAADLTGRIDWILDAGPTALGLESTIRPPGRPKKVAAS